jgi:hypothetical protein
VGKANIKQATACAASCAFKGDFSLEKNHSFLRL